MRDLCLVRYKRLARITDVGISPLSDVMLDVLGAGFVFALSVVLNDRVQADFQVVSDRELLVTLPIGMHASEVQYLSVYVDTQDPGKASDVEFRLSGEMRSGLARTIQAVLKLLLTTEGSDKYKVADGASLVSRIRGVSLSDSAAVAGVAAMSVQSVCRQLMAAQSDKQVPPEERLVAVQLNNVSTDMEAQSVSMSIAVVTAADAGTVGFSVGGAA